jgi:signal transduction histidine kinase
MAARIWTPSARWVFLIATLLGLFSTAQAYRLTALNPRAPVHGIDVGALLVLNLALWYVPAALVNPIFRLAAYLRLDSARWLRAVVGHAAAALVFSLAHSAVMLGLRAILWAELRDMPLGAWATFAQSHYLQNLDWMLVTYAAVVGLSYALNYYRESQARALQAAQLETSLVEARLKALEAQLHPHFLFNTLHAISSLVHSDPEAADRMISRLSDLLRLTFDGSGAAGVPLEEEIQFLRKYLEIEQIRFRDRLTIRFDVDPELLDVEVPRLILQPLVENAIKHGVGPKAGGGVVEVSARRGREGVWLEVKDDGVGLTQQARTRLASGVGLGITKDRLAFLYGSAQRLEIAESAHGLAVRILIPLREAAADATAGRLPHAALA